MAVLKRFSYDNIVEHNPTAPDPVDYDGGEGGEGGEGGGGSGGGVKPTGIDMGIRTSDAITIAPFANVSVGAATGCYITDGEIYANDLSDKIIVPYGVGIHGELDEWYVSSFYYQQGTDWSVQLFNLSDSNVTITQGTTLLRCTVYSFEESSDEEQVMV